MKKLRARLRPGLPVHFLSLRNCVLRQETAIAVDENDIAAIRDELHSEVLQTLKTPRGLEKQIVSKRAPYHVLPDDEPVLNYLEVFEEPPPAPPGPTEEELRALAAALAERELALEKRELEIEAQRIAAEALAAAAAEDTTTKTVQTGAAPSALAQEVHEVLNEKPAPPAP